MAEKINFNDLLYFYRIKRLKNKVSWINSLFYGLFGMLLAGIFNFKIYFAEILILSGIFMLSFSLNDYFDFKLENDDNFIKTLVKKKIITEKKVFFLCLLPLVLLPLAFFLNKISRLFFLIFALISVFYSVPLFRLKRFSKSLPSVLCAGLLFLQAYSSLRAVGIKAALMCILILVFHLMVEQIHRISEGKKGLRLLKALPFVYFLLSLLFSYVNKIFLISSFFSLFRIKALTKINKNTDFKKLRYSLKSEVYSLHEFLIYLFFGVLGYF